MLHNYKMIFKDWIRWWYMKVKIQQLFLLSWNGVPFWKEGCHVIPFDGGSFPSCDGFDLEIC
jgi:hypothetical protein